MANQGVAPPDFTSAVGMVRLNIGDTDPTNVSAGEGEYVFFSDAEISAFIAQRGGNPLRASASIIRRIAGSQALLLKKFTSADLAVDGPAITAALLKSADAMEAEADADDARAGEEAFVIVPTGGIPWEAWRARGQEHLLPEHADSQARLLGWVP